MSGDTSSPPDNGIGMPAVGVPGLPGPVSGGTDSPDSQHLDIPFIALGPVAFDGPWWLGGTTEIPLDPMAVSSGGLGEALALGLGDPHAWAVGNPSYAGYSGGRVSPDSGFESATLMASGGLGDGASPGGRLGGGETLGGYTTDAGHGPGAPATARAGSEIIGQRHEAPQTVEPTVGAGAIPDPGRRALLLAMASAQHGPGRRPLGHRHQRDGRVGRLHRGRRRCRRGR